NMAVVARLAPSSAIRLIALGGEYSRSANGFVGMETIEMLRNYKANRAFFSVTGILPAEGGITNAPSIEAQIKRAMLESSQENYLMIDSSKFGVVSLVNVVPFSHIDHVITDRAPQKDYLDLFDRYEIDLIIAEQNITADRNAPSDQ
ncbi:MAG: DeoR/GlpR family DNA-binding transcription regulator, partial [Alkalispirochaeta sp.]